MPLPTADNLRGRTLSLVGTCKNAGKTTVLNALLRQLYASDDKFCPVLTGVGRDGESVDVVTGTDKPRIFVREGTLVMTAEQLLSLCDCSMELLLSTDIRTPLGEVYIFRARSAGFVQVAGPSVVAQIARRKPTLLSLGDCLLVDGAAGRRSLGAASLADDVILCVGAGASRSMEACVEEAVFLAELMTLPLLSPEEEAEALAISGAVTDRTAEELLRRGNALKGRILVAEDSSCFLLSPALYGKLSRLGAVWRLRHRSRLLGLAVNPVSPGGWRFDAASFAAALAERSGLPVWNVKEGQEF